jgi:hypothetical protein
MLRGEIGLVASAITSMIAVVGVICGSLQDAASSEGGSRCTAGARFY